MRGGRGEGREEKREGGGVQGGGGMVVWVQERVGLEVEYELPDPRESPRRAWFCVGGGARRVGEERERLCTPR